MCVHVRACVHVRVHACVGMRVRVYREPPSASLAPWGPWPTPLTPSFCPIGVMSAHPNCSSGHH